MQTISVVLATYNESEFIDACLSGVLQFANEIVVVDGSSTDDTVERAKKYTKNIIITDNPPIFHINKQKAIDAATSDWVLQLDADEIVDASLKEEILHVVNSNPIEHGFYIPRKNYFLGRYLKKGGQYPDYTLRLYRRGRAKLPCKSVHEQAEVEGTVGYLHNPLIHNADPSFDRYLSRFNRYTSLLASELHDKHVRFGMISFLTFFMVKPMVWFLMTYVRHKGFEDGFSGFVFSCFSSLRFPTAYIKYWEKNHAHRN